MHQYPTASPEEIDRLKRLVRKTEIALKPPVSTELNGKEKAESSINPPGPRPNKRINKLFDGDIAYVDITREPLKFDNPVVLLNVIMPELKAYKWQFEELMLMAGYASGYPGAKTAITAEQPLLRVLSAANGSGKDLVVIAAFAVWFALTGARNRVIITSSSFDQTKSQTEVHINEFIRRINAKFGKLFHSVMFHHIVPELGSEIKLFATDEPGRAEGWHPYPGGRMAIILNEAKSIKEELFDAIDRCTGYSYLVYISSPGFRRGRMYKAASSAVQHPAPIVLGQFNYRRVTAFECPHIPRAHIDRQIYEKGEDSPWVRSSIYAEFSDYEESVVIPEAVFDACVGVKEEGSDIGIGVDLSGGGDETYGWVRCGNRVVHKFGCRQKDTLTTVDFIDKELDPWRTTDYIFRADNGGIGQAMIDGLRKRGWRVRRTNNQSPAYRKTEFLNLGAEMYFDVKRLIARKDIILPTDPIFKKQLTTRAFDGELSKQGKFALQPKKQAIADGYPSPDRADAYVLCFSSYKPRMKPPEDKKPEEETYNIKELLSLERKGLLFARRMLPLSSNYSQMVKI